MHFCLIFFFLSRQYTNHQRPPPGPPTNGMTPPGQPGQPGQPPPQQPPPVQPPPQRHHQQPSPNENMYANLGQHPQLPPNFQRQALHRAFSKLKTSLDMDGTLFPIFFRYYTLGDGLRKDPFRTFWVDFLDYNIIKGICIRSKFSPLSCNSRN